MIRKLIAVISAVSLLLCMIPLSVFAEDTMPPVQADAVTPIDSTVYDDTVDVENLTAEDIIGEAEQLRDAQTKHFLLSDGSFVAVSYPVDVHEQVDGQWVELDNSLENTTDAEGYFLTQTAVQNIRYAFVNGKGNGRLIKAEDTRVNAEVIFELVNAKKKDIILSVPEDSDELFAVENVVQKGTYVDILPGTDIEYIIAGSSLKENIIVHNAASVGAVSFVLRCKNVTAALQEDDSVVLSDTNGNTVFTIPAPFMTDAAGAYCDDVAVTLAPHQKGYTYTVTPSTEWTADPARVYPVTIDPVMESELTPSAIQSTMIKEAQGTNNFKDETIMWVGNNTATTQCYGLIQVDLPTLSAADYVTGVYYEVTPSATLPALAELYNWSAWDSSDLNGSMALEVHAIESAWSETTVTWNTCPEYDSTILDVVALQASHAPSLVPNGDGTYSLNTEPIVLNITKLGKTWYTGEENYGILLKLNNEGSHTFAAELFTDQGEWIIGTQSVHPQVKVCYRSKAGLESFFSYTSASAGTAGTAYAQLNSGNLVFVHDDLALGGSSMPVSISHVYNTCNVIENPQSSAVPYGNGWTLNYAQTITEKTIGGREYAVYTDADATKHYFDITEEATEYEDQSGLELKLNIDDKRYLITDKDHIKYRFEKGTGLLSRIKNPYGKKIEIAYDENGRINGITDGLLRVYTFAYTNGILEAIFAPDGRKMGFNYGANYSLTRITGSSLDKSEFERNDYTYSDGGVLTRVDTSVGDRLLITSAGSGASARVTGFTSQVVGSDSIGRARGKATIAYGLHETTVTDHAGDTVTYQFNPYGNTKCLYNSVGQAQYYRYHAPNAINKNGTSTYGVNKLEAASQTHWVTGNYLLNPDFENTTVWKGDVARTGTECYDGATSLVLATTAGNKTAIQEISLVKGETYTASCYVKKGTNQFNLYAVNDGAVIAQSSAAAVADWQRVTVTFTVPATASSGACAIYLNATGTGTTYVDCVQLEKDAAANRYNHLVNSDFRLADTVDTTLPRGWDVIADGDVKLAAPTVALTDIGLNAQAVKTYKKSDTTDVTFSTTLSQTVLVKNGAKGTTLSYGSWMMADSLPDPLTDEEEDTVRFGVKIALYDGSAQVQTQFTAANRFCEDWQFVGDVIVADKAFNKAVISLVYANNCNTAFFDGAFLYRDYFGQSFTYDDDGNVISTKAFADQNASFEYSSDDELISSVSPDGATYSYTYNAKHDVKTGTSAEGVTAHYTYNEVLKSNSAGLLTHAQTVLGSAMNTATVGVTYDTRDLDPKRDEDDNFNYLISETTTDVRGNAVTTTYNPNGTVASVYDSATGITTSYTYDVRFRTTEVTAQKDGEGNPSSTVKYTYDSFDQLTVIESAGVFYVFTYQKCGRLLSVAVGDSVATAVPLSTDEYAPNEGGVYVDKLARSVYGNGHFVEYTYDDRDRVVALQYEEEDAPHYTFSYDKEGNLVSQTSFETEIDPETNEPKRVATTVRYQYDLSNRLMRVQSGNYALTYEYADDNTLTAVKECVGNETVTQSYVYNRDNLLTKLSSSKGGAIYNDYSYDRRDNLFERALPTFGETSYGFVEAEPYSEDDSPVSTKPSITLTGNGTTFTNENAYQLQSLDKTHRYELSLWYRMSEPKTTLAGGTLTATLSCSNNKTQPTVSVVINPDGKWHYVTFLLTATDDLYDTSGDFVSPTLSWTGSQGVLVLNGLCFSDEQDVVLLPGEINENGVIAAEATATNVTDNTAPMPSTIVRKWIRTGTSSQSLAVGNKNLLTATPRPGETWEVSVSAKLTSGTAGDGFNFRFRVYNEAQTAFVRNASTATGMQEIITNADGTQSVLDSADLTADGKWHTFKGYVTVAGDAYGENAQIVPYFGWKGSTEAGTILLNGLTVRKVGDQWNDAKENFGFTASAEEVTVNDAPIAYQKTVKIVHSGDLYSKTVPVPAASFPQKNATDTWTLSFWAKLTQKDGQTTGGAAHLQTRTTNSGIPTTTSFSNDGAWHYYAMPLSLTNGVTLDTMICNFVVGANTTLYLNGMSLVPGTVALANENDQDSAALKNVTIDTGSKQFNTAIEYDTDEMFRSYSRVKHYIIDGKAYSYSYDDAGNIAKIQNPDGSWVSYEYDALNQLTAEHHSLPLEGKVSPQATDEVSYNTVEYSYDTRGNILSKTYKLDDAVVDTVSYAYGVQNESQTQETIVWGDCLTNYNGTAISYDAIGNPTNWINGETFTWQHGRQLASYAKDGKTISYTYNSDGIRTSKTEKVNGIETKTTYNIVDGVLRSLTQGNITLKFLDNSVIFNGTQYWYVQNAQNDIIGLIDANGDYVVQYTYDSWGKLLSMTCPDPDDITLATLNPFRYRGYIYDDETEFYYCQSRYYDPVVGRWLNVDNRISSISGDLRGYHLYAYCFNNPINKFDSTGNWPTWNDLKRGLEKVTGFISKYVEPVITYCIEDNYIKHQVPLYNQGDRRLCWAYCQMMVEDYQSGIISTQNNVDSRAVQLAIQENGIDNWNSGDWPTNLGEKITVDKITNIRTIHTKLQQGPLYAYYKSPTVKGRAHLVVVTGVNCFTEEVYTNNPHGICGQQSFNEFLAKYANGDGVASLSAVFTIMQE